MMSPLYAGTGRAADVIAGCEQGSYLLKNRIGDSGLSRTKEEGVAMESRSVLLKASAFKSCPDSRPYREDTCLVYTLYTVMYIVKRSLCDQNSQDFNYFPVVRVLPAVILAELG